MAIKNEVLAGHLTFGTTQAPNAPNVALGAYNAKLRRSGNSVGVYILTVSHIMGPPIDDDLDLNVTSSKIPGAGAVTWNGWTVRVLGVDANGDREYELRGRESLADGTAIIPSDSANIVVRVTVKRVNPRAT